MRIALHVRSGPATGQRFVLRRGQSARFGKTDWSDYAFADDAQMADVHFEVHCDSSSCSLRALTDSLPTLVNSKPVTTAALLHGDLIRAGQSEFEVILDSATIETTTAEARPTVVASQPKEDLPPLAKKYGLSADGVAVAEQCFIAVDMPKKLLALNLVLDAVRWQAHQLPKPQAVAWACQCVRRVSGFSALPSVQQRAVMAAEAWARDPSEENRKKAAAMIDETKVEDVGGALAVAAGWSGGSLAPEGQEIVPPDEMITGRAVFTALLITSYLDGPAPSANDRMRSYLGLTAPAEPSDQRGV